MTFNYLKTFERLLENTEVPQRFTVWCGIASLLAALERRIWINQGVYTVYPNFYMVLVAASGQKKSTAINTVAKILRKLEPEHPNVISQKITPEALISALRTTNTKDANQLLKETAGGIVIADELATFLDRASLDRGLGPMLTALYDCTTFEYTTIGRGAERIENGYLSMLGGTTVELLKNALPKDAIGGGFTSRTMFIYEEDLPPPVAWIDYNEELVEIEQILVDYLQRIMVLKGPVELTREAKERFIAIYNSRYREGAFRLDPMLRSYENRRHAHLFKVAIALMVSDAPNLVMDEYHIQGANIILEEAEAYLPKVMELVVSTDVGLAATSVYQFIAARSDGVPRSDIVRRFASRMDARELSGHLETLCQSGKVDIGTNHEGKLVYSIRRVIT